MRKLSLLTLTLCTFWMAAMAQNSKINSAMVSIHSKDYERAYASLDSALDNPSKIRKHNLPKAHYYRAKMLLLLYPNALRTNNEKMLSRYTDAYYDAAKDLNEAQRLDKDGTWEERIYTEKKLLYDYLIQYGTNILDDDSPVSREDIPALERAVKFIGAAVELKPKSYVPLNIKGQIQLRMQDYGAAIKTFEEGVKVYRNNKPRKPDLMVTYLYYHAALANWNLYKNSNRSSDAFIERALAFVRQAKGVLQTENYRFKKRKGRYSDTEVSTYEDQYMLAQKDFNKLELELYMHLPSRANEAMGKFAKACETNPRDYTAHVGYAKFLEPVEPEKALKYYKKAISIDGTKPVAYYYLGSYYLEKANKLIKKSSRTGDPEMRDEALTHMRKAKPYFENAYRFDDRDLPTINALIQVCSTLGLDGDAEKYRSAKASLPNN